MKYNPKLNEDMARLPGFATSTPCKRDDGPGRAGDDVPASAWLAELSGFKGVSLQPAAGAHGEFAGILMVRAYHLANGDTRRTKDHHPRQRARDQSATTAMAGLQVVEIKSDATAT